MPDPGHSTPTAFLSHNGADKALVEALATRLEEAGIDCWLDKWNLVPGDPWDEAIEDELQRCDVCIVFLGPNGVGPWHNQEMRAAIRLRVQDRERKLRVVPVILPGGRRAAESELPLFLQGITWVEFRRTIDEEDTFHRLKCGVLGVAPGRRFTGPAMIRPTVVAEKLPYLCDRSAQWKELCDFLDARQPDDFRRPILWVVHGAANEAHGPFVERLCTHSLPAQLKRLGLGAALRLLPLKQRPLSVAPGEFAAEFRRLLAEEIQMETVCRTNEDLLRGLHELKAGAVAALTVSSDEVLYGDRTCFELVRSFWSEFPDLPPGLIILNFITIKFPADSPGSRGWFRSIFKGGTSQKESSVRERLAVFGAGRDSGRPVFCKVLPELKSVSPEDVARWAEAAEVSPVLPQRISEKRLKELFQDRLALPMDDVIDKLSELVQGRAP